MNIVLFVLIPFSFFADLNISRLITISFSSLLRLNVYPISNTIPSIKILKSAKISAVSESIVM